MTAIRIRNPTPATTMPVMAGTERAEWNGAGGWLVSVLVSGVMEAAWVLLEMAVAVAVAVAVERVIKVIGVGAVAINGRDDDGRA